MKWIILLLTIGLFQACPLNGEQSRVIIITGASRGIGLASAHYFAEKGCRVYGTLRASSKSPPKTKDNIHFLTVDLTDEASIQTAVQTILQREGHIDVLINNAGYALVGPVETLSYKDIQDQMEINFYAPIRFIQAVLPSMRKHKMGHIINISSTNAFNTPPYGSMYAASKAALESFSESLCIEVQPFNITVSIVEPWFVSTNSFHFSWGTKKLPNNPYQNVIDTIKCSLAQRSVELQSLSNCQSPGEIAQFLYGVIQDPHPKLRYQTSEQARKDVSMKLRDLTGDLYLAEKKDSK